MATSVLSTPDTMANQINPQVLDLGGAAEPLIADALQHAREKLSPRDRRLDTTELCRQPGFIGYLMPGLAPGVAAQLAASDPSVRAVYSHDPELNADSEAGQEMPADAALHLLVVVKARSAALTALIEALDQALIKGLQELSPAHFAHHRSCLEVTILTENEVRLGLGAAGRLSAVFSPPIKVWERAG